jgi:DNA topoisomerase-1
MGKSLVVVESPAKAKTINKILGKDFVVKSCMGHVRDLPPKELGVDVEHDFKPRYVTIRGKSKVLGELRKAAQEAEMVYLATDPDREGEAIAWHVAHAIDLKEEEVRRILFNEITPKAVREAIAQSGRLDMKKVNAQQARRVLDRLVGYEISPLLWKVIHSGLSAGRVQSVALRQICERDLEIAAFKPEEYWSIEARCRTAEREVFSARLLQYRGEKLEIPNQEAAERIVAELRQQRFVVAEVKQRDQLRHPSPPFITSTLQQECARRLRFSVKRTMTVAQQLYEGVEIEGETRGLITYMRTDSVRVAAEAVAEVRQQIRSLYGAEYLPEAPNAYKTKRGAQDAHEAIRPTYVELHPAKIKGLLTTDQARVYEIIWKRFVASQMKPQVLGLTTVDIGAGEYLLRANGSATKFPGFTLLYTESREEREEEGEEEEDSRVLPAGLARGQDLEVQELKPEQHFTKPPPRYTEASLVKELEAKGIGRPSTYAQIITTLQDREYVERAERNLIATERGHTVNKFLVETFPHIFDVKFTAQMEDELDRIEEGDDHWIDTVRTFYSSWNHALQDANSRRRELKQALQEESTVVCEECGRRMVVKWGRNGRFLACPGYPQCKNTKPLAEEQAQPPTDAICDLCQSPMVVKSGRYGRFLACSSYPECKNVKPLPLGVSCPDCNTGELVEKQSRKGKVFYGCNRYPACKFASWDKPVARACPHCEAPLLFEKGGRSNPPVLYCRSCHTQLEAPAALAVDAEAGS